MKKKAYNKDKGLPKHKLGADLSFIKATNLPKYGFGADLTKFTTGKGAAVLGQAGGVAMDTLLENEDTQYLSDRESNVQGTLQTLSNVAIASGNPYAMGAGLIAKGGMALYNELDPKGTIKKGKAKADKLRIESESNVGQQDYISALGSGFETKGTTTNYYAKGGPIHNPNGAASDLNFQTWYKGNTLEGKNNIPYSEKLDYDYYSFYKNKGQGDIKNHFPDTYKKANHPTFSNESSYAGNGAKGYWKGETFVTYAKGGKLMAPEYEVEKGEVVQGNEVELEAGNQLASDMHKVGGNKHTNGGTEGAGGERVYTDQETISSDLYTALVSRGYKVKANATYADVATTLGKAKGNFENKLSSHHQDVFNTGKMSLNKIDELLDLSFREQESMKKQSNTTRKYALGGPLKDKSGLAIDNTDNQMTMSAEEFKKSVKPTIISYEDEDLSGLGASRSSSAFEEIASEGDLKSISTNGYNLNKVKDALSFNVGDSGTDLSDTVGQMGNVLMYGLNKNTINKMETKVPYKLSSYKPLFSDSLELSRQKNINDVKSNIATATRNIKQNSSQNTTNSIIGAMVEGNKAINNIDDSFRNAELGIKSANNQGTNRNQMINTQIQNEAMQDELSNRNVKRKYVLDANNAFAQGVMGNRAMSEQKKLDKKKMLIELLKDGNTHALSNILKDAGYNSIDDLLK
jgi:hypothetical protein